MRTSYFNVILFLLLSLLPYCSYSQNVQFIYKDPSFLTPILRQHNSCRSTLQLSPMTWSDALAKDALVWARHLAAIDKGQHDASIRGKEGENIFWGTSGAFTYEQMVDFWVSEKKSFKYGVFPDCRTEPGAVVGHYTQIVWKNTTAVGCALASNGKTDYLVCRYSPPGNVEGEKPY